MSEFNPQPVKDDSPDADSRFVLALAASLALHLALAFGVQIKAQPQGGWARPAMEVNIEPAPRAEAKPVLLAESSAEQAGKQQETATRSEEQPVPQPPAPAESPPAILPALEIPLLEDPTWYPAKQLDVHPSPLRPVRPAYPQKAEERGIEGYVVLLLLIDAQGEVKEISVAEANPEDYFEESALAAFRKVRFAPAQKNGRAVKSRVLIRVTYELNKAGLQPPVPFAP